MSNYNQLSYGSQGSDVTELQKRLNQNGYNLSVDGIFGKNTQDAVRDYQQKNKLTVDGIVGTNTWGALTKANTSGTAATGTPTQNTGFQYGAYQESDAVKQAQALLQQQLSQKPGEYTSPWQTQLSDTLQKILNREPFSYDINGDALYQQYKDQYALKGQQAMMDTMGQAQAMTGGYGNSYAQSVGQQAYQGYMQQLTDKIPELYQLALSKHQMEGDDLKEQAALMAQMEGQDYGRYRDQVSDYNTEMARLQDRYDTERQYDYSQWADNRDFGYGQYIDDLNYQYQQNRDQKTDAQWQAEFDEAKRRWEYQNGIADADGNRIGVYTGTWTQQQEQPQTEEPQEEPEKQTQPTNNNPTGKVGTETYNTLVGDMNALIKNGASKSEINAYLRNAKLSGVINQSVYESLKEQYAPRGATYR